jgi:hypothetical protein
MGEIYEYLSHGFVKDDRVRLLEDLSNDLSLVVLDDEDLTLRGAARSARTASLPADESAHLLRLDHPVYHDQTKVREDA